MIVKRQAGGGKPPMSVVIVDSRSKEQPEWVQECIDSVKQQTLDGLEIIILDNKEKMFTIGRMYNQGLQAATADWVMFLGDDDFISPDYCSSLFTFIEITLAKETDMVIASTFTTFFDEEKQKKALKVKSPQGCYKRDYFLNMPFDEGLNYYVDINILKRVKADNKKMVVCPWHFGYFYRSHKGQTSGKKLVKDKKEESNGKN